MAHLHRQPRDWAPYPWATTLRAVVHPLKYLLSDEINIKTITGELFCKSCNRQFEIEYDLEEKFREVASFILKNKEDMDRRAPVQWMNPSVLTCTLCENESARPVINKKRSINWLFLLLGQMLGFCTLSQLKYFCKHTGNNRTGAKDRLLYITYLQLCNQVDPQLSLYI